MILTFAQGIVRHATTTGDLGDPQNFLSSPTSNRVDLNATREQPLMLSVAERDAYYLLSIIKDGGDIQAWGYGSLSSNNAPMVIGQGSGTNSDQFYLYVDIDKSTGEVSYGYSKYDFSSGTQPTHVGNPQNRPDDTHWFNTTNNTMNVWRSNTVSPSYGSFVPVARVFIAKYTIGASLYESVSLDSPSYIGTQVGVTGSFRTGSLIFDANGNIFKRSSSMGSNVFFTTEDLFTTQLPTSTRVRIESFVVDGLALSNLAAYTMVRFNDFNQVTSLTPALQNAGLFGIIEEGALTNQLVKVAIDGVISNPGWNWDEVNQQIFVGTGGELVTTPVIPNQVPVAFALSATTIVLRPARVTLTTGEQVFPATSGELGTVRVSVDPPGSPIADPTAVEINDPILVPGNTFASEVDFAAHIAASTIHFTEASIDHANILNIGTNSHADIDNHLSSSNNPHNTLLSNLGDTDISGAAKGELFVHDGTDWVDLGVGADGEVLTANSIATEGVGWAAAPSGGINNVVEDLSPQLGANLDANSFTITGLPTTPVLSTDVASKAYVDSVSAGLDPKESVRAATTAVLTGGVYNSSGGTGGTGEFTNVDLTNIDTLSLNIGDRLLVKDQPAGSPDLRLQNGIYVVTTAGATGVIERAADHDGSPSNEVSGGNYTFVEQGTTNIGSGYTLLFDGEVTLNSDPIVWTVFTGGGAIAINDLTDVDTASTPPIINDVLSWTGTEWEPKTLDSALTALVVNKPGMEVYVKFNDDVTATTSTDEIGNYTPGQLNYGTSNPDPVIPGQPSIVVSEPDGRSVEMPGFNGAVSNNGLNVSGWSHGTTAMTVGMTVKITTPMPSGGTGRVLATDTHFGINNPSGGSFSFQLITTPGPDLGKLRYTVNNSGVQISLFSSIPVDDGTTYNIICTWDNATDGRARIYIDGALDAVSAGTHLGTSGNPATTLRWGGGNGSIGPEGFLDECFYSSAAWNAAEIAEYNGLVSASTPTTIGPYDLAIQAFGTLGTTVPLRVFHMIATRAFRISGTGNIHQAHCVTGPTGSNAVFDLRKNNSSFGTVTFTTGGGNNQTVTFSVTQLDVLPGDLIDVRLITADSNDILEDVMIGINATNLG